MFQFIIGLSFLCMVFTPAILAGINGKKEFHPKHDETRPGAKTPVLEPVIANRAVQPVVRKFARPATDDAPTLPLHRTLGFSGR